MGGKTDQKLIIKGKRLDGRKPNELRPISVKARVIPEADGSCEFRIGETIAIAAVYGPKKVLPKHLEEATRAYLNVVYDMAAFSTAERNRPGPSRRSREISKVMVGALAPAIYLERYPQTNIDVFIEILNANAGTRTAAINAASVALADAGIEMRDLVTSVAGGKINNTLVLDLFQAEDNFGDADVPIAIMPRTKNITLLQMDGNLSKAELKKIIAMCIKACDKIYKMQKKALVDAYNPERKEVEL